MREDICSIPISEIFEPKDGCPFCRMRDMLEDRMATYITGAAMMEPDVRVETNKQGFCKDHFEMILQRGSRLSVALILESLLDEIGRDIFPDEPKTPVKKVLANADRRRHSCFVCDSLEKNMEHLSSTVIKLWQTEPEFRELYAAQTHICLNHYSFILRAAQKMPKKNFTPFAAETKRLSKNYLDTIKADTTHFCRMFDYRNAGGDWGNSRDAIERSITYITGREPSVTTKTEGKNR